MEGVGGGGGGWRGRGGPLLGFIVYRDGTAISVGSAASRRTVKNNLGSLLLKHAQCPYCSTVWRHEGRRQPATHSHCNGTHFLYAFLFLTTIYVRGFGLVWGRGGVGISGVPSSIRVRIDRQTWTVCASLKDGSPLPSLSEFYLKHALTTLFHTSQRYNIFTQ